MGDAEQKILDKRSDKLRARQRLLQVCADMDMDGNGELSFEEIVQGYKTNPEFSESLKLMDVGKEDLHTVFSILDSDRSRAVTYLEFVDQLHKMKTEESHTLLVFIKHYVGEIRQKVSEQLDIVRDELLVKFGQREKNMEQLLSAVGGLDMNELIGNKHAGFS